MESICSQSSSPFCKLSVDGKEKDSDCPSVTPLPIRLLPLKYICTSRETLDEDEGFTNLVNENEYVPFRGAVNFPDVKFIAPPTFSLSTSKGIGLLDVMIVTLFL